MDDKELCDLVCNPTIDGYLPNPLYSSGYCPEYMKTQCYADGTMFEEQWENHQDDIKDFNARKLMSMSFKQRPLVYDFNPKSMPIPPTTRDVYKAMVSVVPTRPAKNTLPARKKSSTKKKSSSRLRKK